MDTELILQGQIVTQVQLAGTDKHALNTLLHEYMPFIKKCVSSVFPNVQSKEDNLSEAMLAFAHSVQTYKSENGAFIPYAQTVIRNRLLNAARRETGLKKSFFSISLDTQESEQSLGAETARRHFDSIEEQQNLKAEIIEINAEFDKWGFDCTALIKNSPRQERSRRTCHRIARKALMDTDLVTEMLRTRKLPIQRLTALSGVSEKTLEKYRRYIAAVIVIMRGDYPYIHSFLPHFFDEEESA